MKSLVSVRKGRGRALLSLFAAACFAVALLVAAGPVEPKAASAEETAVPIDMYLIGGQSNGVGYSPFKDLPANVQAMTFENVMYAGETDRQLNGVFATNTLTSPSSYVQAVRVGLGKSSSHIGPEFGIAEVINDMYNDTDRKAIIFKSAAGGTALRDVETGNSLKFGNWYPRSRWNAGYDPATIPDPKTDPTGVQYSNFVKNFEKVYNDLKAEGYAPEVKGMFWMQGEADYSYKETYRMLLTALIEDLREDISGITGNSGDAQMPFVIGEIAETYYDNTRIEVRREFNAVQREVAASLPACSTVRTNDLIIVDPETGVKRAECPDQHHFCGKDARTLGNRAGEALVAFNTDRRYASVADTIHGTVDYRFDSDNLVVTLSPEHGYKVGSLLVNGTDRTEELSGNVFTLATGTEKNFSIAATFVKAEALRIKREYDISQGSVSIAPMSPLVIYPGDTVTATVTPKDGYRVKSVTFEGREITAGEDGKYVIGAVAADGTLKVEFELIAGGEKGGCSKQNLAFVLAAVGALAVAAVVIKK